MNSIRREEIKKFIEKNSIVSLKELAAEFSNVSVMTIHRDLDALEDEGVIVRVRGGAKIAHESQEKEPAFEMREDVNREAKEIIAKKAVDFIKSGSAVFLDAGTTTMALAKAIPDINVSVVTSGPNIALEVSNKTNPIVSVCGGTLNRSNLTLSGSSAIEMLSKINIDVAFLVASGYSHEGGFTCGRESEAYVKRTVANKARTVILLMDTSKVNKMLPFTFADLSDIDFIISDNPLPKDIVMAADKAGVSIL